MSDAPVRELVEASAGSGKTFRISSRIIGLLARGEAPSRILASTFTRKAAGEILDRVLKRLAHAATDPRAAAELAGHAGAVGADPEFWRQVLQRTLRAIHELDVATLDSFFSRAVRAFGHDLGLPSGWTIADEATAERIRARSLEATFASLDRGAMVELVRGIRGGDARRSIHGGLSRDVDGILEVHRDLDPDEPGWSALTRRVEALQAAGAVVEVPDEARRGELAASLEALPVGTRKDGTEDGRIRDGRDKLRGFVLEGKWEEVGGHTLVVNARDGGKGAYYGMALEGPWRDILLELDRVAAAALLAEYEGRARAMARIAASYEAALDRMLRDGGTLRFDDVTRLVGGDFRLAGRSELGYRLDGRIRHLLLDEFQDTSLIQWRALRPLLETVAGEGAPDDASASVVADPKQSIYGWRGAAPVVVKAVERDFTLRKDSLSVSYRSSPVVLGAVNTVFENLPAAPHFEEGRDAETAAEWGSNFREHTAHRPTLPGHVTLSTGPAREGNGHSQPALMRFAAERIARLHRAAPQRSLGVLLRRNEAVARIILELRDLGVHASEEGGTRLADSAAVVSVLALLRLAEHPANTLARYHVAHTPLGALYDLRDHRDEGAAAAASLRLRTRLVRDGYGATLAGLRREVAHVCSPRDLRRLDQLVELGYAHDLRPPDRVDDFVAAAMLHRTESGGGSPVRVMTVWGAKGLEFDMVVLPELFLSILGSGSGGGPPLAFRPDPSGPVSHAFPPMNEKVRAVLDGPGVPVAAAYDQQRAAAIRDGLSSLYVAMTRARYALHMIIPAEPKAGGKSKSPARLLRWALEGEPTAATIPDQVLYEAGDAAWAASAPLSGDVAAEDGAAGEAGPIPLRKAPRRRMLPRRRPSDHGPAHEDDEAVADPSGAAGAAVPGGGAEEAGEVDLEFVLGLRGWNLETVPATVRGSVVHAWMEGVDWLEEGLPGDAELARLARREAPELSAEALAALVSRTAGWLRDRLEEPPVRAALSRKAATGRAGEGAELRVERELPFYRRSEGALVEGIIDRLVLTIREGAVVEAHVLDYKTDAVAPGDGERLRERTEFYAPQLRAYREAVAGLYRISPGAVRLTLLFLEAGEAVEVA